MSGQKPFSIIVETENLGMVGIDDLEVCLDSLKNQTYSIKNITEVLLIVGGHISKPAIKRIKQKYPWVKIHLEKDKLDYAKSKMKGAEIARGKVLIFADSDMKYERTWLENMIKSFELHPKDHIMSGDTRLDTTSAYKMSLNSTWMIQILSDEIDKPVKTSFFPLNNFAIYRNDMLKEPLPHKLPLYRNKIPIWEKMLIKNGFKILRVPRTRGIHAPPGNLADWWYRMLIYGADFVSLSDFSINQNGEVIEKKNILRRFLRALFLFPWKIEQLIVNSYKLLKEDWQRARYFPGALFLGLFNSVVIEFGALIACLNRDLIFRKITAREEAHIV